MVRGKQKKEFITKKSRTIRIKTTEKCNRCSGTSKYTLNHTNG